MSYILDALRRADAERSRGAVPGLHDQNAPADAEPAARDYRPLIWAAGGAGALLVAVVVVLVAAPWRASAPGPAALAPPPQLNAGPTPGDASIPPAGALPATPPGALAPAAVPVEPPISRVTSPAIAPPAAAVVPATTPAPTVAPTTIPPGLADRAAQGRVGVLESRADAARTAASAANANAPAVEHYGPPVTSTAASPAPARPAAIPNIADLPPDVRAALPRLVPGGAMDSTTPADRMLILNGQVFHEGDKPAPDTLLEQIHLKSAVLDFRGQRYVITY